MKKIMQFRCAFLLVFATISFAGNAQNIETGKIRIIDFKVVKNQNRIDINWATDNTTPVNYFEVEKSNDGKNFKTLAYILGPDPSKSNCDCYGSSDNITDNKKESYYRLKHVDTNGEVEFSETRTLALNK